MNANELSKDVKLRSEGSQEKHYIAKVSIQLDQEDVTGVFVVKAAGYHLLKNEFIEAGWTKKRGFCFIKETADKKETISWLEELFTQRHQWVKQCIDKFTVTFDLIKEA